MDLFPIVEVEDSDKAWDTLAGWIAELVSHARADCLSLMVLHIADLSEKKRVPAFECVDEAIKTLDKDDQSFPSRWLLQWAADLPLQTRLDLLQTKMAQLKQALTADRLQKCTQLLRTLPPDASEPGFDKMFDLALPEDGVERLTCLQRLSFWLQFTSAERRVGHLSVLMGHLQKLPRGDTNSIARIIQALIRHAPLFEPAQVQSLVQTYLSLIEDIHQTGVSASSSHVAAPFHPFDTEFVSSIADAAYLLPEKAQRERFEALLELMSHSPMRGDTVSGW